MINNFFENVENMDDISLVWKKNNHSYRDLKLYINDICRQISLQYIKGRSIFLVPFDDLAIFTMLSVYNIKMEIFLIDSNFNIKKIQNIISKYDIKNLIVSKKVYFYFKYILKIKANYIVVNKNKKQSLKDSNFNHFNSFPKSDRTLKLYTLSSGTSGKMKVIVRDEIYLNKQLDLLKKYNPIHKREIVISTLPLFTLFHILTYNEVHIVNYKFNKDKFNKLHIDISKKINLSTSPYVYTKLRGLYKYENICIGGSNYDINQNDMQYANNIYVVYGSSEVEPISYAIGVNKSIGYNVGKPILEIDLYIDKIYDNASFGEICVKSKVLKHSYLEEQNIDYFKTQDIGTIINDELILLGRKRDYINQKLEDMPYVIEKRMLRYNIIGKCIIINNKPIIITTYNKSLSTKILETNFYKTVYVLKSIPYDYRHNGKLDYKKVFNLLETKKYLKKYDL